MKGARTRYAFKCNYSREKNECRTCLAHLFLLLAHARESLSLFYSFHLCLASLSSISVFLSLLFKAHTVHNTVQQAHEEEDTCNTAHTVHNTVQLTSDR